MQCNAMQDARHNTTHVDHGRAGRVRQADGQDGLHAAEGPRAAPEVGGAKFFPLFFFLGGGG